MHTHTELGDTGKGVILTFLNSVFLFIPSFSTLAAIVSFVGSLGALVLTGLGIYQAIQKVKLNKLEIQRQERELAKGDEEPD